MWFVFAPVRFTADAEMVAESDDSFAPLTEATGLLAVSQPGPDLPLGLGDAVGLLHAVPAPTRTSQADHVDLVVPHAALVPLLGDLNSAALRLIPQDTEPLRLLTKYLAILLEDPSLMTTELRHLVVTHVHDLIAMALSAKRDGAAPAHSRGVRAARLRVIKADILESLGNPELTVSAIALRQRVTPRYVHMLFETEGISFSKFVLDARLRRAHRMLSDPRCSGLSVSAIAFAVGFGDLSYFNRTFRRRFGVTPSGLRHSFHADDSSSPVARSASAGMIETVMPETASVRDPVRDPVGRTPDAPVGSRPPA
jgi:AraC-like DNA-binding protein